MFWRLSVVSAHHSAHSASPVACLTCVAVLLAIAGVAVLGCAVNVAVWSWAVSVPVGSCGSSACRRRLRRRIGLRESYPDQNQCSQDGYSGGEDDDFGFFHFNHLNNTIGLGRYRSWLKQYCCLVKQFGNKQFSMVNASVLGNSLKSENNTVII